MKNRTRHVAGASIGGENRGIGIWVVGGDDIRSVVLEASNVVVGTTGEMRTQERRCARSEGAPKRLDHLSYSFTLPLPPPQSSQTNIKSAANSTQS